MLDRETMVRVAHWAPIFGALAQASGLRPSLVAGLIYQESGGNPAAQSPVNRGANGELIGRAQGLGQVMPWHFGLTVGEDGEIDAQAGRHARQPGGNLAKCVEILEENLGRWGREDSAVAAYFGAVDGDGNPTAEADVTGTPGMRYVELVLGWAGSFRFLDSFDWSAVGPWDYDLDYGQCAYGETWREAVSNLYGVATDALNAGREARDHAAKAAELWGAR